MRVFCVPVLSDNYVHIAAGGGTAGHRAVVVDPGEGGAVLRFLAGRQLSAEAVLVTHLHADHIGGLAEVRRAFPAAVVYAPENSGIRGAVGVRGGDVFTVFDGAEEFRVLQTPGHTPEHISFFADSGGGVNVGNGGGVNTDSGGGILFCGDVLFGGGCGRILGGTMEQMHKSLALLKTLPDETGVYCGHEYTQSNLEFAAAAEPDNKHLRARIKTAAALRAKGEPTVPSTLGEEKRTNPFLRLTEPAIIAAAQKQLSRPPQSEDETFAALRRWKDNF